MSDFISALKPLKPRKNITIFQREGKHLSDLPDLSVSFTDVKQNEARASDLFSSS